MLNNRSKFKLVIGIADAILGSTAGSALAVADNDGKFEVVPPDAIELGNTYGEWSARWWQWLMSLPKGTNPNLAFGPVDCTLGQTGQVWFLAGLFGGVPPLPPVTRSCTIPAGKDLLLPSRNTLFGQGVGDCTGPSDCDPTALRELAAENIGNPKLEVSIDNIKVKNLDQYRVTSPVFEVFFPQEAVLGLEPGTHGPVVSDGFFVLLKPLSRGSHIIQFSSAHSPHGRLDVDVTYHLTVTK